MSYPEIVEKLYQVSIFGIIQNVFTFFLIFGILRICISVLSYLTWRRKISKTIPSTKMRFYNVLGNVSELPFSKKSRNGQSVLVYMQQLLLAHSKLLEQEKLYSLWLFFHPLVVLSKAEAIEAVYSGTKFIQSERPIFYRWLNVFLGNGLITSSGERWKTQRKLLNPCFRSDVLKEHLLILNEQSRILVKRLEGETEKDFTKISKYLSSCTFDIICEVIYGLDVGAQRSKKETAPFVYSANIGFRLLTSRCLNIFLWSDFLFHASKSGRKIKNLSQVAKDFTTKLIKEEKEKFLKQAQPSEKKGKSLVKRLLTQYYLSKEMSEEDIRDQLMTFMIAGQDTSKISVSWILYMLGLHADILTKVHEELDLIFGEDHERHANVEDLKNMKYLDCVIKETLRLYPPLNIIGRYIDRDTTICGYQIPKGTTCVAFPHVLHRDERMFPNSEKFDPDRFLPENSTTFHPYAWIPFGAGPRNCIGKALALMELLTITSTVLRRYTVESLDHRDKVLPNLTVALASSIPLRIRIRPRQSM